MNIELVLKYKNDDFGLPNKDGSWKIRNDIKSYSLLVDGVEVISINVEYERFNSNAKEYSCAYISYSNNYFTDKSSKYNNKGYATKALKMVTRKLLNDGIPKITLNINDDNIVSKKVGENAGYAYIKNNEYSIFHPDIINIYEKGLSYLKEIDEELYEIKIEQIKKEVNNFDNNKSIRM